VWGARTDARTVLKSAPRRSLARVYFDTIVFDRTQLEHLVNLWGADHVLVGTDYPYDMGMYDPRGFVEGAGSLTAAHKAKIMGLNAARLLKIKAPAAPKASRARGRR
jgi:aminocarboxymuconate-semialdehyde decarboxylase